MICDNCKKEVPKGSKFCVHCGKKIKKFDSTSEQVNNESFLSKIAGYIATGAGFALGYFFGWIFLLIVIVPFIVGHIFSGWYLKERGNTKIVEIIMWSNLVAWLLPIAGYFTSGATIKLSELEIGSNKKKRLILGYTGFGLSLVNSIIGVLGKV